MPPPAAVITGAADAGAPPRPAGYRLVRVLGEGRSAVVHLGCTDADPDQPARTVAIKVYRPGTAADRIDAEVAALGAVDHPHALRLLDLATADDGLPCLVLERHEAGGLARLVAGRPSLSPGEAVTILAPIVAAAAALHAAGYVHRDIRLPNILFADSGAPVLCGFGHAARIDAALTPAGLAAEPSVVADRRHLLLVVRCLLERLDEPLGRPVDDWLEGHSADADDFDARLIEALFDLADAQPVRLRDQTGPPVVPVARLRAEASAADLPVRPPLWRALLPGIRLVARHAKGVRRRYWTIAGGVAVCLVAAVFAVPQGDPASTARPGGDAETSADGIRSREAGDASGPGAAASGGIRGGGTEAGRTESPGGTGSVSTPVPGERQSGGAAVSGDDPVAALVELIAERERCVRDLSVLCLDAVLQQGSAALERDTALIRAVQSGGELTADATVQTTAPVLVERLGDSAIVDLGDVPQTQPASALMMRGEAGWRIRDYLDD